MKVKCPSCGFKAEAVDGKCQICDLPIEAKSSLMMKFHSMSSFKIAFLLSAGVIILVFASVLLYVSYVSKSNTTKHNPFEPIPCLVPIEGCLGIKWGDSMETAIQKITSQGYKINKIDDTLMEIYLGPIKLAGKWARVSILKFYSKGFYEGHIFFLNTNNDQIVSLITAKYGPPSDPNPEALKLMKSDYGKVGIYSWMTNDKCEISILPLTGSGEYPDVVLSYKSNKVVNEDAELVAEIKARELLSEKLEKERESLDKMKRMKEKEERLKILSKPF